MSIILLIANDRMTKSFERRLKKKKRRKKAIQQDQFDSSNSRSHLHFEAPGWVSCVDASAAQYEPTA